MKFNYKAKVITIYCNTNLITCFTGFLIRLVGGSLYNEGRVEVNYNGEWGTVCDDGWDDTDAGVVCRQLGFGSSGTAIGSAGFGPGSGSIWLDTVTCTGSESTLISCGHLGLGVTVSCDHAEDVGVTCSGLKGLFIGSKYYMYLHVGKWKEVLLVTLKIQTMLIAFVATVYKFIEF